MVSGAKRLRRSGNAVLGRAEGLDPDYRHQYASLTKQSMNSWLDEESSCTLTSYAGPLFYSTGTVL